jgi:WD40 repeat protein
MYVSSTFCLIAFLVAFAYPRSEPRAVMKILDESTIKLSERSSYKNAVKGAFSADGKLLALVGRDSVRIVDVASGDRRTLIELKNATMLGARFLPGGMLLATAYKIIGNSQTNRFEISLWNVASGSKRLSLPAVENEWYRVIDDLSFSPDGGLFASNLGGIARLWKTADGKEGRRFAPPDRSWQSQRVLLTPDGNRLAVYFTRGNSEHLIRIWTLATDRYIDLPINIYRDWTFSPDSKLLAVTAIQNIGKPDERSAVEIWDVNTGERTKTIEVPKVWRGGYVVAFSPDGSMIAIGGYKNFGVFSTQSGQMLAQEQHPRSSFFRDTEMVNELTDIEFSPDGKLLLTGGQDGTVKLWSVAN